MPDVRHRKTRPPPRSSAGRQEPPDSKSSTESPSSTGRKLVVAFLLSLGCLLVYYCRSHPAAEPNFNPPSSSFSRYPSPSLPSESDARSAITTAIKNSWRAYAGSPAWGCDEFHSISQTGTNLTSAGSIGFFIIDVIDTILLTGDMEEEYQRARKYVENDLSFDVDGDLNAFETTIRILGGLLSVYHLAGNDTLYLDKAIDLGTRLLPIFDSVRSSIQFYCKVPTGVPYSFINLKTGKATADWDNRGYSSLAEATLVSGTLQLEFKYLAELSQRRVFWDVAERVRSFISHCCHEPCHGRVQAKRELQRSLSHSSFVSFSRFRSMGYQALMIFCPLDGSFFFHIRLGSRGDSYYEYLIKQYLQTNRTQAVYREMYDHAMAGVKEELVRETPGGMVYVGELHPSRSSYHFVPKQDHLVCFLGGLLLLGVTEGERTLKDSDLTSFPDSIQEDWLLGKELIKSCVDTYKQSSTGLGPEIVRFTDGPEDYHKPNQREWHIPNYDPHVPPLDARNILRPETVESLFFAWRATKDPIYREWGWEIFQAFNEHCKIEATGAFASIKDVDRVPPEMENKMETFWIVSSIRDLLEINFHLFLAETLKYLLLLFSDDSVIPLNTYVLNTEAHIFPIFTPTFKSDED
ncbi:hypothetical protein VP01_2416g6 [Puccinia sorghi]|uniref:alpha-1,2-Mannosidase n=1 Tax=Puccinia sorghi TaxID=27349 RepID=A0A0L6V8F7_9BASI|nr:hypothetical protein VP01_2416g6 [Puccinia sorghi]